MISPPPGSLGTGAMAVRVPPWRRRLRDAFWKDLPLKLLSLVLAVMAWALVQDEQAEELDMVARIVYAWPEDMVQTHKTVDTVKVRLAGPRTALKDVATRKLTYTVDVRDATAGPLSYSLAGRPLDKLPVNLTVVGVEPATLRLHFDARLTRKMAVRVVSSGQLPSGFEVRSLTASPSEVTVKGARGGLQGLKEIPTVPLDLTGREEPFTLDLPFDLRGAQAEVEGISRVRVTADIHPLLQEKTFVGVPIRVEGAVPGLGIEPERVDVTLRGPISLFKDLQAGALAVRAFPGPDALALVPGQKLPVSYLSGAGSGEGSGSGIRFQPPEGTEKVSLDPSLFHWVRN